MRLYHVLVVATAVLLATGSSLAAAEIKPSTLALLDSTLTASSNEVHGNGYQKRSLRIVEDDADDDGEDSSATEERAGADLPPSVSTKISKKLKIPTGLKMPLWRMFGRSNDDVKKSLGMENLSGAALKSHKNYGRYVKYMNRKEEDNMFEMARRIVFPTTVWDQKMGTIEHLTPAIMDGERFAYYVRYARIYDRYMQTLVDSTYTLPSKLMSEEATPVEMTVRASLWAQDRRSDRFVRAMLGLPERLKGDKLEKAKNYQYYKHYIDTLATTPK